MENSKKITDVIIYCRVSSEQQVANGNGLESQQIACERYCRDNKLNVVKVFQEPGVSGDVETRPGFEALMEYIKRSKKPYVVMVYDITRLARNVKIGLTYIDRLRKLDCRLLSVVQPTDDSPMGQMMEVLGLAFGELWRKTNREVVISRMDAQLSKGRRMHGRPPIWYRATKGSMEPREPNASIVRMTYERVASGELPKTSRIMRKFMEEKGFTNHKGKLCSPSPHHIDTLKRERAIMEAAGFIPYKGEWIKAEHAPIISLTLAKAVLKKLNERQGAKYLTGQAPNFPLRGFMRCSYCNHLMTASSPNKGTYSYYSCIQPSCIYKHKNIPVKFAHQCFADLLQRVVPTPQVLKATKDILKHMWKDRMSEVVEARRRWQQRLTACAAEIQGLMDDARTAPNQIVKDELYAAITRLGEERVKLTSKLGRQQMTESDFEKVLEKVFEFLKNPCEAWLEGDFGRRSMIQKMVFPTGLPFTPREGFRNPDYALPFRVFEGLGGEKTNLVGCNFLLPTKPLYKIHNQFHRFDM